MLRPTDNSENGDTQSETSSQSVLGPEALVRREDRIVRVLRVVLLAILIIVGSFLSLAIYKLTSKWEHQSYEKDLNDFSSRVTLGFLQSVSRYMWSGSAMGLAVTASSDLTSKAPEITIPMFKHLSYISGGMMSYWAPLLEGDKERKTFEAFANAQPPVTAADTAADTNVSKCWVCGSQDLDVGTPEAPVADPVATITCANFAFLGANGVLLPQFCSYVSEEVQAACACGPRQVNATMPDQKRSDHIYQIAGNGIKPVRGSGMSAPIWQVEPATQWASLALYDLYSDPIYARALDSMVSLQQPIFSELVNSAVPNMWNTLLGFQQLGSHTSLMFSPVFSGQENSKIIGSIILNFSWQQIIGALVPLGSDGMTIVLENTCGQQHTFSSIGNFVTTVGAGDHHDPAFSATVKQSLFEDFLDLQAVASPMANSSELIQDNCAYRVNVYGSAQFRSRYITRKPLYYATAVILIFIFTAMVFVTYDCYVTWRQRKLLKAALQTDAIVTSLFPAAFRSRIIRGNSFFSRGQPSSSKRYDALRGAHPKAQLRKMLGAPATSSQTMGKTSGYEPVADFFPLASVVFVDISGFTAWCSEHEPSQIFQLLETVYQEFDRIANRVGVFKIETIGDCYVAAAGVPEPQPDHAVLTVKFAYECLLRMNKVVHELDAVFGPSTSSLSLRIGVHSGPITAGVLRGERARFQLFGDTVNMASRLQTTGQVNMIQISHATAELLRKDGKSHWIQPRDKGISIKGKGSIQTYWADPHLENDTPDAYGGMGTGSQLETRLSQLISSKSSKDDKIKRLVEWNTDLLLRFLKKVVVNRNASTTRRFMNRRQSLSSSSQTNYRTPIEDLTEILPMSATPAKNDRCDVTTIELGENVRLQLLDYVRTIASLYRDNPFHDFEHASHVAMSASKIIKRIIQPEGVDYATQATSRGRQALKLEIHRNTFGTSSDVLMQFAVVFSAVIHDVDHTGVSNAQLVKEGQDVAVQYNGKCVAEQNSVEIAWKLLMEDRFIDLRRYICSTDAERDRFRQLLVNAVIATDIADKELQQKRKDRWDVAFHYSDPETIQVINDKDDMDRKATIVFEYIIQASDVAHTMQHWKVYNEWNERLFKERYLAYLAGREEKDPSVGWYNGEIWFFDNYIIPLAKKLETCGVFGVSPDEYLGYALENRREWELKGKDIVAMMLAKYGMRCEEDNADLKQPNTVEAGVA